MKKSFITFLSVAIVLISFFGVADNFGAVINVQAETQSTSSTTQKPAEEQEFTTTTTTVADSSTSSTTQQAESTTNNDGNKQSSTSKPTIIDWGDLTSSKKNEESTTVPVSEKNSEDSTENEPGTEIDGSTTKTSTTKKKTTTKKYKTTTVPKITIPVVDNTQIEGTTLSPLDAYFERISDVSDEPSYFFDETTEPTEDTETQRNLSMGAIIAICIGGIALVTCALTGLFVLRNKKAAEDDEVEYDDEYEDSLDEETSVADISSTNVDNTGSFKIVNFDSDDYK